MSKQVAISTLRNRVRVLCGLPQFTATTTITTDMILDFLQTACVNLGGIVGAQADENYLSAFLEFPVVAGVSLISLPDDCTDLLRLSWIKSASEELDLEHAQPEEQRSYPSNWNGTYPVRYRLIGNAIELYPTPDAAYTLRAYYTTGIYVTSVADTILCRPFWDQWIVYHVCQMVRGVQQKSCPEFDAQLAMAERNLRDQLRRDKFTPRQARDVRTSYMRTRYADRKPW